MISVKTLDGRRIEIQCLDDAAVIPCGDCGEATCGETRYLLQIGAAIVLCSNCLSGYEELTISPLARSDWLEDAVGFVRSGNELVVTVRFDLNC